MERENLGKKEIRKEKPRRIRKRGIQEGAERYNEVSSDISFIILSVRVGFSISTLDREWRHLPSQCSRKVKR
jgi:hypothetical protein